jgi:hypothetical protein
MGAVIVTDEMDIQPGGDSSINAGQELLELRRPVAAVRSDTRSLVVSELHRIGGPG